MTESRSATRLFGERVLFVNNFAHEYLGGGEVHLMHLVRAGLDAGMDVSLVAPLSSAIAEQAQGVGAHVYETDFSAARMVQTTHELREIGFRGGAPAIVHGTGYFTNLMSRSAGELVVNTVHTMSDAPLAENPGLRSRLSVRVRALVDRATTGRNVRVVCDSSAIASSLPRTGARVSVIHNGVDPEELAREASSAPVPQAVADERAQGRRVVGCVSRLERVKGVADLVDAAALLADLEPDAVVLIAGAGSLESELRERIAARTELAGRVRLLGFVESAAAFTSSCDLFVLPSHSEGFNTTVLEAMALGVPVVATEVGGITEAVEDRVSGRIVPAHDPAALAQAIAEVLGDSENASRMSHTATARVAERFTVARMTAAYLDLYAEMLDESSAVTR